MDGRNAREDVPTKADPSQAEIRERCWEIQDTWTERQRREREGSYAAEPLEFAKVSLRSICI